MAGSILSGGGVRLKSLLRPLTAFAILGLASFAGLRVGAVGTTRYVDDATCPATGAGTLANPYCHIQDGICNSVSGDTVSVAPGTYLEAIRMKIGVSVISQAGAATTIINALNQPCTDSNNLCAKRAGSTQCSVVTFGSNHTSSTVLQGFTLTGGQGLPQPVGPSPTNLAGGGIYVFSSPTILNNIVTNNILSGPSSVNGDQRGAGIYVAVGSPVISGNTISGNRAVPPAGNSSTPTFGYGGGVWMSVFSSPSFTQNIVQGNQAGDPNAAFSLGTGGGIISFGANSNNPAGHLIDRNLIADNLSDNKGGGVALTTDAATINQIVVTNNVIVGNSAKDGGGVYEYFVKARIQNNTITGNNADLGGGVFLGQGDVALPVSVTGNIIDGNTLNQFGTGGGIYKWDLSAAFEPTISFNLFYNNAKNHVAGDRTDADTIGVNGNLVGDPRFVNRAARDYHLLDANSPAIDRATATGAPTVDKDGAPRGVDGNGIPNNPVAGDVDIGAYERQGSCSPSTEVCDGADNDCDFQIDEGLGTTICGVGACEVTQANCIGGVPHTCTPGSPTAEVCDNVDNNCNGSTDEGLGSTTCGVGTCQVSVQNCINGSSQTCTPGSPVAEQCDNLDNNCNGSTDEGLGSTTCGEGACQNTVQNCVGGNIQTCTPGAPSAEVCGDGIDNNCNGVQDDGFPNFDGDGMADCVDPDDDNDGANDPSDCAPLNATAFATPIEVGNLDVISSGPPTSMQYQLQVSGSGTTYTIIGGSLLRLAETGSFQESFCLSASTTGGTWNDNRPNPRPGEGIYYLIRASNACGTGTFGSPAQDATGSGNVCQLGIIDADGDGTPSNVDCDDANPNKSPFLPELCDGVDNNCDQVADEGNPGGGLACGSAVGECSPGVTQCTAGGIQCVGAVGPAPELCDGFDNDCNGIPDDNVVDTDHDGQNDCVDGDDDNDAADDGLDCAPLDSTAFGLPVEVQDLDVLEGSPTPITWIDQALGSGTRYDLATGQITSAGMVPFGSGTCLPETSASPATDSRPAPAPDTAWYYMVKSRNSCGTGTYGTSLRDTHPACP